MGIETVCLRRLPTATTPGPEDAGPGHRITVCRDHAHALAPVDPATGIPDGWTIEAGWSDARSPVACPWCPMRPDGILVSRPRARPDSDGGTWTVTVAARYHYTPLEEIALTTAPGEPLRTITAEAIDDAIAALHERHGPLPVDRRTQGWTA